VKVAAWWPIILLAAGVAAGGEVSVRGEPGRASISVVRRVDVGYYLVTGTRPLEFDATGPEWLRVYTRLWWPAGAGGRQIYRLVLSQDDADRPVEFEVGLSGSSHGPGGRKVGEWRSFFVQVPPGATRYRLALERAASDTVAVRIVRQAPKPWLPLVVGGRTLSLVEGRDTLRYHELAKGAALSLELDGPCRVRVRARLNFGPTLPGTQSFVVTVTESGKSIVRRSLRAGRSPAAVYADEPGLVPSSERTLSFSLAEGRHRLSFGLSGTLAASAAVRVEFLPVEKYE
jgi:hypothetical protein